MVEDMDEKKEKKDKIIIRILFSALGCFLLGVGSALMKLGSFGNDSFAALSYSIGYFYDESGIAFFQGKTYSFGSFTLNVLLFIPFILFLRKKINIGTLFNVIGEPIIVDLFDWIFHKTGIAVDTPLWVRIIAAAFGFFLLCLGIAFFVQSDMGVGPYDAVNLLLAKKLTYKWSRVLCDFSCVVIALVNCSLALKSHYDSWSSYWEIMFNSSYTVVSWFTVLMFMISGPVISFLGKVVNKIVFKNKEANI